MLTSQELVGTYVLAFTWFSYVTQKERMERIICLRKVFDNKTFIYRIGKG